jgi:hypothetical protein
MERAGECGTNEEVRTRAIDNQRVNTDRQDGAHIEPGEDENGNCLFKSKHFFDYLSGMATLNRIERILQSARVKPGIQYFDK